METQHAINELLRMPSPAPKPLGLAFDGTKLWMGSRETNRIYAIDPATWTASDEGVAPGSPFGMTVVGDELRVVLGHGEADDRAIHRFIPGHGFKSESLACPEHIGAHLAFDGDTLFLTQATHKRILALDGQGNVIRTIDLPRRPVGMTIVDGNFYVIDADDEFENLCFNKVDAHGEQPVVTQLATVPFEARGLTFDGSRFWTSDRDNNQIVAFERPA
jgi:DNA-binding beta-propeller fold protein YncE